jgi:hypothetical protein
MLEKYNFLAKAELLTTPPSSPEDFDVGIALDTAVQNRLGNTLAAVRRRQTVDQYRSSPQ